MTSEELLVQYIEKINVEILQGIDYDRLDLSCNSTDTAYAVETLKNLHQAFVEVYGTDDLDSELEFVNIPAVLRGRTSGHLAIGLVTLDLSSAGEHYGSNFFTRKGVIDDGASDNSSQNLAYLNKYFMPYDYWYTAYVQRDHHVDFERVPAPVADILDQVYDQLHPEQGDMKME